MTFDDAQHQAMVEKLNTLAEKLDGLIRSIGPALQPVLANPLVPDEVKSAAAFAGRTAAAHARAALTELQRYSADAAQVSPSTMHELAEGWRIILATATSVSEGIKDKAEDAVSARWKGVAMQDYAKIKPTQAAAANRIGAIAKTTAAALDDAVVANEKRLGTMVVATIALVAAVAIGAGEIGTGVLAPKGVVVIVIAVAAWLATIVSAELEFEGRQKTLANGLKAEVDNKTDLGKGLWPKAVASDFRRATPEDDSVSDWDVKP